MTDSPLQHLIHMGNQIADNNTNYHEEAEAVQIVVTHMKRFWARSMKQDIIAYAKADGSELNTIAKKAVRILASEYDC